MVHADVPLIKSQIMVDSSSTDNLDRPDLKRRLTSIEKIKARSEDLIERSKQQVKQSSRVTDYSAEVLADIHDKRRR